MSHIQTAIIRKASLSRNERGDNVIKIQFSFNYDDLEKIRSLPGRTYHKDIKCWSAPICDSTIQSLIKWGYDVDERIIQTIHNTKEQEQALLDQGIPGLKNELRPFQIQGVAFKEKTNGRALNADEMGLGKTIQTLAWLQTRPDLRPAVIIVPAFLKLNWQREALKWMSKVSIQILSGKKTHQLRRTDLIIVNYDILSEWVDRIRSLNPKVMVTDECHYYKTNKTKRTHAVKKLAKCINHVIALSGTPILNKPIEIYNAIKVISPDLFPNWRKYTERYCDPKFNGFGTNLNGASNTKELHQILTSTIMIRRLKKDVMSELPDKVYSFVPFELDNEPDYKFAENNFISYIRKTKSEEAARKASNAEALTSIETLKQLAVRGKLNSVIQWIESFLESDNKLVVFTVHRFVNDTICEKFPGISVKVDGSVSNTSRQEAVDKFQNDDRIKLFVGNVQAAGVGITLTASSNVAFVELPWTPGALVQAEDRCHRIGQKDSVNIYFLLAVNTIEEKMAHLIDNKRKILDAILDGTETNQESLLSELIKSYT